MESLALLVSVMLLVMIFVGVLAVTFALLVRAGKLNRWVSWITTALLLAVTVWSLRTSFGFGMLQLAFLVVALLFTEVPRRGKK
jgi:hypothetical protein